MYPFIILLKGEHVLTLLGHRFTVGPLSIGTFGILLWLAAVSACWVLYKNFERNGIDADAISVVAVTTVAGVIGAKLWHVLETPHDLFADPVGMLLDRAGFAWFGGLIFGILALLWQGRKLPGGMISMLDLASPAAAIGYAVGRIGCLVSGDGDYGMPTTLPWGMSFPHGLVPTTQRVHPTPIYEMIFGLILGLYLWQRGVRDRTLGELTGEYLLISGIGRFLVEFIRINPRIYFGMSNAQVASLGSILAGLIVILWSRRRAATAING